MKVSAFLICIQTLLFFAESVQAGLVNRWSFNSSSGSVAAGTSIIDSVSGAALVVRGTGASYTGTQIRLPGTTNGNKTAATISAYLDLPNGIISSKTNLTVEMWATPLSVKNWMRVFDFGRVTTAGVGGGAAGEITGTTTTAPGTTSASDNLMLSFVTNSDINTQRMESLLNGANYTTLNTAIPASTNTQYHYVFTFEDGVGIYGSSGGQMTWYRNGVVIATGPVPFHLSEIEDVNNWLGRSQWSADMNANASYNEVRIYNDAMSPAQVAANRTAGPNSIAAQVPPPALTAPAQPVNRWSFNNAAASAPAGTPFTDTIGSAVATVRGNGAALTGSAITLPGTTTGNQSAANISAYIDLPNGIVSSKPNFSAEFWVTPLGSPSYQRLFDVGRSNLTVGTGAATGEIIEGSTAPGSSSGYDNLVLSLNIGTLLGKSELEGQIGGASPWIVYGDLSNGTSIGTEYHYVMTVEDGAGYYGSGGSLAKWYRDGVLQGVLHLNFHLSQMSDVNNWIGRSQYTGDYNSNIALSEVRLYNRVLTPEEIELSYDLGPNASFGPPVTHPDSAVIQPGQKVIIPVLANDTGSINPTTVEVASPPSVGTASVDSSGQILYAHAGTSTSPVTFTYRVYGLNGYTSPETVTVMISDMLRISNSRLQMPTAPPASSWETADALPGVTFNEPLCIASVPGNTKRLLVCERMAKIKLIPDVTASQPTSSVFLDIQSVVANRTPTETIEGGGNDEHGLLGLAFHPNYASNGYFYVAYTVRISGGSYYQRISRFKVSTANPDLADPASEFILLQQLDEGPNHDGGDLHFGPDGYLYYCAGDEENANDFRLNSQKIDKDFFSGIFRIDVDKKAGNLEPNAHAAIPTDNSIARFSVPADNPFIHTSLGGTWNGTINGVAVSDLTKVRTEFWAYGLRHVWRFSFDSLDGTLWAGDVGQDTFEEVDIVTKGGNYGWVYREGKHDTNFTSPVPPTKPAGFTSIDPVYEYIHTNISGGDSQFKGNSVCGGVVYRGSRFPGLYGAYIFCDSVSGHIWKRDGITGVVTRLASVPGVYGGIAAMGTDPSNQDVLFADYLNGRILRLAGGTPANNSFPATLSATGLFADLTDLSASPGLLPYEPNLAFWSDYAVKRRWFGISDAESQMSWSRDGNWSFPTGMLWVKHFDMELTRGDSATRKRLETRVLVKTDSGAYGVSYRWNDAQTNATLVPEEGVAFDFQVVENGVSRTQHWEIPGRTSCLTCHTPQAGHGLSFTTRQMNRSTTINRFTGNQITLLKNAGYFSDTPDSPNVLPRHVRPDETAYSLEARARSFLTVNCSYCHQQGGTGNGIWDGRAHLSLPQTQLINGSAENNGGDPVNNKLIVPGDITHSIIYNRVATTNGFTRMPPLATSELDQVSIALLRDWINQLPSRQTYEQWRLARFGSSISAAGDSNADPDGDGRTNMDEFLALTNPLDAKSYLTSQVNFGSNTVTVSFGVPAGRSVYVETSSDLQNWTRWDVAGNGGSPMPSGTATLTGSLLGPKQFFRLQVQEN